MKHLPWLRLYTDIVDDEKIRLLAFQDRWHFVALLALKGAGVLDEKDPSMLRRKIAVKTGLQLHELDELKRRLIEVDLIDEDFQPVAWEKRQFNSDSSAERTRKYRERKAKEWRDGECDVTETSPRRCSDALDTDTDTDTDTEKNTDAKASVVDCDESQCDTQPKNGKPFPDCPYQQIVDQYHTLTSLPRVKVLTNTRKANIRQRWREYPSLESWAKFFTYVENCDFLCGRIPQRGDRRPFVADLEWLTKPSNFAKVMEGRYDG